MGRRLVVALALLKPLAALGLLVAGMYLWLGLPAALLAGGALLLVDHLTD